MIHDLFERIVLYDVDVTDARVEERADGRWNLKLAVDARKLAADGLGNETEEPLRMEMDIGAFAEHPRDVKDGSDHIVTFERREIVSGSQEITLVLDEKPAFAGVDPYNKLIDRRPDNNLTRVEAPETAATGR